MQARNLRPAYRLSQLIENVLVMLCTNVPKHRLSIQVWKFHFIINSRDTA